MEKTMKAVVYSAPGRENGAIKEIPIPEVGEKEVLVKVAFCGICKGADGDIDKCGTDRSEYPITPGHEFGGIVEAVGKGVKGISVGDRVTADPTLFCEECDYCKEGKSVYCEGNHYLGHDRDGCFSEYALLKANKIYKVPENLTLEEATFAEPIACCIHGIKRANPRIGETAIVLGSGCSGILMAQLLKHSGVSDVIVIAGNQNKLDILNNLGVNTIRMDRKDYSVHENALFSKYRRGVDIVVDTTGSVSMISSGFNMLKKGGRLIQYAVIREAFSLDILPIWGQEKSYIPTCCTAYDFPEAMLALEKKWVEVKPLITARYKLEQYFEALDAAINDGSNIKVMVEM